MQRSTRMAWVTLCIALVGCSLATDFDRDKIGQGDPDGGGGLPEAGSDGSTPMADGGGADSGMDGSAMDAQMDARLDAAPDAPPAETGPLPDTGSECTSNDQCSAAQLCCNGLCVNTSVASRCTGCNEGCSAAAANSCNNRTCGCDNAAACGGDTPYCVANGSGLSACAECADNTACADRSDGKTLCISGRCAACNPTDNSGCSGNTPICNGTTLTCEACTASPNNCTGSTRCTASGACGGCAADANCSTPTTPICNTAANPTVCRGCGNDGECAAKSAARPYCNSDGTCGACKVVDKAADVGCDIASTMPACRVSSGNYQCLACNSNSQCESMDNAGTRTSCRGGRCVQCAPAGTLPAIACDDDSPKPFCDSAGLCQSCMEAGNNANARNQFCATSTANARSFCDASSGHCVACTDTQGCGTGTNRQCLVVPASPSTNRCVECETNAHCTNAARPFCDLTSNTCKVCTTATGDTGCTGNAAGPICAPSGVCTQCIAERGCSGVNGTCLVGAGASANKCVDCITGGATECAAATPFCAQNTCVACLQHSNCPDATPLCDGNVCRACVPMTADDGQCNARLNPDGGGLCTIGGLCRRCDTAGHRGCDANALCCPSGMNNACSATGPTQCASCGTPCTSPQVCKTGARECVACNTAANCAAATPICTGNMCVGCTTDNQCAAANPATPICNDNDTCTVPVMCSGVADPACALADPAHPTCGIPSMTCECALPATGACAPG